MTVKAFLIVGLGGFIGSAGRYGTSLLFAGNPRPMLPYGTMLANMLGCLLIGIIYGLSGRYAWFSNEWRLFLATGICGGYTTFSAFALENIQFLQEGQYLRFAAYSLSSFILGLLAVWAGIQFSKI